MQTRPQRFRTFGIRRRSTKSPPGSPIVTTRITNDSAGFAHLLALIAETAPRARDRGRVGGQLRGIIFFVPIVCGSRTPTPMLRPHFRCDDRLGAGRTAMASTVDRRSAGGDGTHGSCTARSGHDQRRGRDALPPIAGSRRRNRGAAGLTKTRPGSNPEPTKWRQMVRCGSFALSGAPHRRLRVTWAGSSRRIEHQRAQRSDPGHRIGPRRSIGARRGGASAMMPRRRSRYRRPQMHPNCLRRTPSAIPAPRR
jgi:hypothetical protein